MLSLPPPSAPIRELTLLRPSEVAEVLGTTTRTVRALAARGELRKVHLGNRATRYRLTDIEEFIARRTSTSVDSSGALELPPVNDDDPAANGVVGTPEAADARPCSGP